MNFQLNSLSSHDPSGVVSPRRGDGRRSGRFGAFLCRNQSIRPVGMWGLKMLGGFFWLPGVSSEKKRCLVGLGG